MLPLFVTQVFGQLAAIVYNAIYYQWRGPDKRSELRKLYAWAFAMHCVLSLYTVLGLISVGRRSRDVLGYVGIVIDVWMFASPLGTLKRVMETKSAPSIPINLSLMLFVSTSLWAVSGLVDSDYFVAGLNAIGSLLSVVQIVFYLIYRPTCDEDTVQDQDTSEISVIVTPSAKCVESIQSPVYKMLASPTTRNIDSRNC